MKISLIFLRICYSLLGLLLIIFSFLTTSIEPYDMLYKNQFLFWFLIFSLLNIIGFGYFLLGSGLMRINKFTNIALLFNIVYPISLFFIWLFDIFGNVSFGDTFLLLWIIFIIIPGILVISAIIGFGIAIKQKFIENK